MAEGLWAIPEPGCAFKSRTPPEKWPACVTAVVVKDGKLRDVSISHHRPGGELAGANTPSPFLVAAGDPEVVQIEGYPDGGGHPSYQFLGLRPLASDEAGVILRARVWPVLCAPPPGVASPPPPAAPKPAPSRSKAGRRGPATRPGPQSNLLPGLMAVGGGKGCIARTAEAVRHAVAANEAWAYRGEKDDGGRIAYFIHGDERAASQKAHRDLLDQAAGKVKSVRKYVPGLR